MRNDTVEIPAYALDANMSIELTPDQLDKFNLLAVKNGGGLWDIVTIDHRDEGVHVSISFRLDDGYYPWGEEWIDLASVWFDYDELVRVLPTWTWKRYTG